MARAGYQFLDFRYWNFSGRGPGVGGGEDGGDYIAEPARWRAARFGAAITSVGITRDGFRGQWLAVSAGMTTDGGSEGGSGWAGMCTARFADVE